jgi:hypothetical protein
MFSSTLESTWSVDPLVETFLFPELDAREKALFVQVLSVECGCALLRFLDRAADSLSTTDGIAFRLRQPYAVIECSLNTFRELGLVRQVNLGGSTFWGMVTDTEVRRIVRNLIAWQNRWRERLIRVEQLIDGRAVLGKYTD